MSLMLLCPGQGSQHPDMFAGLANEPEVAPVLEAASSVLGFDVTTLGGKPDALDLSENRVAQILITAHCLAVNVLLGEDTGEIFVGYSVGEIAAATCSGAISLDDAFSLIADRVRCMDAAREAGGQQQGMLAVIGIPAAEIEAIAAKAGVTVAIVNGRDHVVLGGMADAIDALEDTLPSEGAHTVRKLPVRVASHTPFIHAASDPFEAVLRQTKWRRPQGTLLSGIDGRRIATHEDAVQAYSEQLRTPLDFASCMELAREHGATSALEIGPGHALTRLTSDILPNLPVRAYEDFRTIAGLRKWLARQNDG